MKQKVKSRYALELRQKMTYLDVIWPWEPADTYWNGRLIESISFDDEAEAMEAFRNLKSKYEESFGHLDVKDSPFYIRVVDNHHEQFEVEGRLHWLDLELGKIEITKEWDQVNLVRTLMKNIK